MKDCSVVDSMSVCYLGFYFIIIGTLLLNVLKHLKKYYVHPHTIFYIKKVDL